MIDEDTKSLIEKKLLPLIRKGRVIPIIGEDLLRVQDGGSEVLLYPYYARKLAELLGVQIEDAPNEPRLTTVVGKFLKGKFVETKYNVDLKPRRKDIFATLQEITRDASFEPPETLRALARIDEFKLFIDLTFVSLLAQAVQSVRKARTQERAYSPTDDTNNDLPDVIDGEPIVYHLFGKLEGTLPDECVVTEDDMLEYLHRMQQGMPANLGDALKGSHLLFLGCNVSDWPVRFLIRVARGKRLSDEHPTEVLVRPAADPDRDSELVAFLRYFSSDTKMISCSPHEFVDALVAAYGQENARRDARPADEAEAPAAPAIVVGNSAGANPDMKDGAVFLSYAHEDATAVLRLHDFLTKNRIDVWLDQKSLHGRWQEMIDGNIDICSYFIPLLSKTSASRHKGKYREEWSLAIRQIPQLKPNYPFIIPVIIDDTDLQAEVKFGRIPDEFAAYQAYPLRNGEGNAHFADLMKKYIREYWRSKQGP